jgi:hypothetical protein
MKKLIPCLALAGCAVVSACSAPTGAAGVVSTDSAVHSEGQSWTLNGAVYTVSWTGGQSNVEISVRVDNRGSDYAYYPDPSVTYDGVSVAASGWTQPSSGAEVGPGRTGEFQSSFVASPPGGQLQVRVLGNVGNTETTAYWAGPVT